MTLTGRAVVCQVFLAALAVSMARGQDLLKVRLSWGHTTTRSERFSVQVSAREATISGVNEVEQEDDDGRAGAGDVDGLEFVLLYAPREIKPSDKIHRFWSDYLSQCDADTARRLRQDPAYRPDPRVLTVQMDPTRPAVSTFTTGFSLTVDQLLANKAFWVPSLDVYVAVGDDAPSFEEHRRQLDAYKGMRVLDQVRREPEATYEQYTSRWEDMGSPTYKHPSQPAPGHIVCLTWDSALYKFGIDRWAGVWSDYGNPDPFRFRFDFGEDASAVQRLADGLPVITTTLERDGLRYQVEQFAYPLNGPPGQRRGDIPMVLLQKITATNPGERGGPVSVRLRHRRQVRSGDDGKLAWRAEDDAILFEENVGHRVLFTVEGPGVTVSSCETKDEPAEGRDKRLWKSSEIVLACDLAAQASRQFVVKLASPPVGTEDVATFTKLDYAVCRETTLRFWEDWLRRGAQFTVPEKVVNDLYRANLWHALRLPRRHGGQGDDVQIDLPYSNFAYDQHGTPWPVNQAVYVDYMIYALRGYHDVAAEEMLAMYRNNQDQYGHVGGFANWGVYTPAMIYVTAKNYLLSGDRQAFDHQLPHALRALDWCRKDQISEDLIRRLLPPVLWNRRLFWDWQTIARNLVRAPLNDLTGDGVWAFNQAYVYAAFDAMGAALMRAQHWRAQECVDAAKAFGWRIQLDFSRVARESPLVQLRDGTWSQYIPCEAETPGRLLEQWYPADVDTGAMHLLRLKALPPQGVLADALLNDHEDNLYLHGWGMANEPVYNPQATAYLLRDEPKAAIRAFYSMMACAFSHSVLEPVEHRWTWGQYFGPPSTDGAWFELYRNMLIRELDDDSLLLMQATPRKWLADGQKIAVERAPTYYGDISFFTESHAASGTLTARIDMPRRSTPKRLLVRFRHPDAKPIQSVTVDGQTWNNFDVQKEWVVIEKPVKGRYEIVTRY